MDDERRPAGEPAPDAPAAPHPAPNPEREPAAEPAIAPGSPPPASPPLVDWSAPPPEPGPWQYDTPSGFAGLDVMSVFGRTIDTFIAHWMTFVVLSLPAVLGSVFSLLLASSGTRSTATLQPADLLGLLFIPLGIFVTTSIAIATDDVHVGRGASAVRVLGPAIGRTVVAFVSALVVWIVVFGLLIVPIMLFSLAAYTGGAGGAALGLILLLVAGAAIFYLLFRWALAPTAIAIDRAGPLNGLNRSWKLTKGNLWRLGVLVIGIGLLTGPWSIAGSLLFLSGNVVAGFVVSMVGTLLFGALPSVVVTIAYGDITGRWRAAAAAAQAAPPAPEWWTPAVTPTPEPAPGIDVEAAGPAVGPSESQVPVAWPPPAPPPVVTGPMAGVTRSERRVYVLGVFLVGCLLLLPSIALAGPTFGNLGLASVPLSDRGKILAGTDRDPKDPCAPLNRASTFDSTATIYVGGYFSRAILPGQSATVHVQIDGAEAASAPLSATTQMVGCYYEEQALNGLSPAEYRIVVDDSQGVLAEGTFTVK
jgi:hypothetical protein